MTGRGDEAPERNGPDGGSPRVDPIIPVGWARLLYVAVIVIAGALLVIDIGHPFHWTVDDTALGLLGVLLVIPLIEQLRKLKFGNLELELAEIDRRVSQVDERLKREVAAVAADTPDELAADAAISEGEAPATNGHDGSVLQPLDRIVWVDDEPRNNLALIEEFRERYEVETATSTEEGVRLVERDPERTLVISDASRVERGRRNHAAGEQLTRTLRATYPAMPILIFAGSRTVSGYAGGLTDAGADLVTNSSVELGRSVRGTTARRLTDAVRSIARKAGEVHEGRHGLDFVVDRPTDRIGIEVRDWRRKPKPEALDAVWARFDDLLEREVITQAYLVSATDVLIEAQRQRAPRGAEAVTLERLATRLG